MSPLLLLGFLDLFNFLKKYGNNVKENSSLVNKEKLRLLSSYKYYVSKVGDEENAELKNPLNPENEELKEKVKEIFGKESNIFNN